MSDVPLAVPVRLELGTNPLVEYVPALEAAATGVVADHQRLAAMPVTVPAAELGSLAVVGDREAARALVRARARAGGAGPGAGRLQGRATFAEVAVSPTSPA